MSDQPKPATGEWTAERIAEIAHNCPTMWAEVTARELNRLNAAIGAEREKRKLSEREWCGLVQQLREELATERERYEALEKSILDLSHPNCKDLLQQLAAEREKVKEAQAAIQACTCLPMNEADCPTHSKL